MSPEEIRARFASINFGQSDGRRAPHKPLLLLWALGQCLRDRIHTGENRLVLFKTIHRAMCALQQRFGPRGTRIRTHYPFWRLRNDDGIWEVQAEGPIETNSSGDALPSSLIKEKARGGFPVPLYRALQENATVAVEIAHMLASASFPPTLVEDVLRETGVLDIPLDAPSPELVLAYRHYRPRDQKFKADVLAAYRDRCAVCAYTGHIDKSLVAVEAAHIKWHSRQGPDETRNGLALCVMHHHLFDRGAFTVCDDHLVEVSPRVSGNRLRGILERYHGKRIHRPMDEIVWPDRRFLAWHRKEIFLPDSHSTD